MMTTLLGLTVIVLLLAHASMPPQADQDRAGHDLHCLFSAGLAGIVMGVVFVHAPMPANLLIGFAFSIGFMLIVYATNTEVEWDKLEKKK